MPRAWRRNRFGMSLSPRQLLDDELDHLGCLAHHRRVGANERAADRRFDGSPPLSIDSRPARRELESRTPAVRGVDLALDRRVFLEPCKHACERARVHVERDCDLASRAARLLTDDPDDESLRTRDAECSRHSLRSHVERVCQVPQPLHEPKRFAGRLTAPDNCHVPLYTDLDDLVVSESAARRMPMMKRVVLVAASLCWIAACADAPRIDDPEVPPDDGDAVMTWLASGYYSSWRCEPAGHASRSPSPHGRNRVCNNDAIRDAPASGPYPMGAASVKELLDDQDAIIGYAVDRKLADGTTGANWYWFEIVNGSTTGDGDGVTVCVGCHSQAPRDFVFTAVP